MVKPKPDRRNPLTAPAANPVQTVGDTMATLPISQIDRSGGTQIRLRLDKAKVTEYAELIQEDILKVHGTVFYDGTTYWLGDGFHRFCGLEELGRTHAHVEVRAGTRRDAVLHAATEANNKHGLPLSPEDKRNAALTLLRDQEWGKWGDREIARKVGMSHPTVSKLRKQVEEAAAAASGKSFQTPTERKVMRGGTEYSMQTETINRPREIRTVATTWLHSRSSDDKSRHHMLNQLLDDGSNVGKYLWKGLLQFIPLEVEAEEVEPILKAMLQELEEAAEVDGVEYRQGKIEEEPQTADRRPQTTPAAPPRPADKPADKPADEIGPRVTAVKKVIESQPDAAAAILDDLRNGRRGWFHDLILCYCDDAEPEVWEKVARQIQPTPPPVNSKRNTAAGLPPLTLPGTKAQPYTVQSSAEWSFEEKEGQYRALNVSAKKKTGWYDSLPKADAHALEIDAGTRLAIASANDLIRLHEKGQIFLGNNYYTIIQQTAAAGYAPDKGAISEAKQLYGQMNTGNHLPVETEPAPTQRQRQDAAALHKSVSAALLHMDTHPNRLIVEELRTPFREMYGDVLKKLKGLKALLDDQRG